MYERKKTLVKIFLNGGPVSVLIFVGDKPWWREAGGKKYLSSNHFVLPRFCKEDCPSKTVVLLLDWRRRQQGHGGISINRLALSLSRV